MISVSVIIAAYNASATISRAMESCLNQESLSPLEVIVVDDGSTDGMAAILERYADDNRVKVIHFSVNRGPSSARNAGIQEASGQFIALLDADDFMDSNRLTEQLAMFEPGELKPGAVISWTREIDDKGNFIRDNKFTLAENKEDQIRQIFLGEVGAITPTFMIQKAILDVVGLFDEDLRYREDSDFLLRIIDSYGIEVSRKPLVTRMVNPTGLSRSVSEREFLRHRRLFFAKECRLYPFLESLHEKYWSKSYYILGRLLLEREPRHALGYFRKSLKYRFRLKTAMGYLLAACYCAGMGQCRQRP